MSSNYDATEFIDGDFESHKSPLSAAAGGSPLRAPSREEVDSKVAEAQQKLAELKRAQEELERERSGLEETRRRQMEFQTGRQEMAHNLTRGIGLLQEAEFDARRNAEQMGKALADLRDSLAKIEAVHEEGWTRDNFGVELTRALTTLENARMEWNSARLKFPALDNASAPSAQSGNAPAANRMPSLLDSHSFGDLCRIGFAFTWPVAAVALLAVVLLAVFLLRH
jgi:chromosome segregation ATPase